MIYKWRCEVAEPEANESGIVENQGLIFANGLHEAMDKILEYMCMGEEEAVFEFYIEPWDTDILAMDEKVLREVEEDHIF